MKRKSIHTFLVFFLLIFPCLLSAENQAGSGASIWQRMVSFIGIFILVGIAYLLSSNRKEVKWKPVIWGVALQIVLGLIVLSPAVGNFFFNVVNKSVNQLLSFSAEGTAFVLQGVVPHKMIKETDTDTGRVKLKNEGPTAGGAILVQEDIHDLSALATKLKEGKDDFSSYLNKNLSKETLAQLAKFPAKGISLTDLQKNIINDLNGLLRSKNFFKENQKYFQALQKDKKLTEQALEFIEQDPKREALIKLNRLLLENVFGTEIGKSGLSSYLFIPKVSPAMKNFAFWILPTIIFFSALMTLLYHLGIMEPIIKGFAWLMQKTMGTSGSESLSAAANIFVGQTEAPLVVKPFVETMTKSELHAIMVGGFATVAGGVMAVYVGLLSATIPTIAGHLVVASIMSAPAALAISKVMYPETEESVTAGELKIEIEKPDANSIEAAARGATDGMALTLNVIAVLIAFVGIIALLNYSLHFIPFPSGWTADGSGYLSLETILGWFFFPIAFCMGVPSQDCFMVGILLGEKIALTELLAYVHLSDLLSQNMLSPRSGIIASYALCGFANFASIGIQIGGIGGIAPSRRGDLAKIGLKAMIGGAIAACMTGTIAGILIKS